MDSLFDDPRFVSLEVVLEEIGTDLDALEEEADQTLTDAEIDFTEEGWGDGAQCRGCGQSALSGQGGLCLDCEVSRPRRGGR